MGKPAHSTTVQLAEITADEAGQRIDNYLLARLKGVPKSRIYRLLRKGEVRVNKKRIKPEYRLLARDLVRIPPVRTSDKPLPPAPGTSLRKLLINSILLETDSYLVVDKPAGLAVHGGSGLSLGLIEAMRALKTEQSFLELVHRLDRGTSGCLLLAKKRSALRSLQQQMREGRVTKVYQALVKGHWPKGLTRISAPLRKNTLQSGERMVRPDATGKAAITHFRTLQRFAGATLIEARLETGRTHQIRVHCQQAGHPLAGDDKYGDAEFNALMRFRGLDRLFLHAAQLAFEGPQSPGEPVSVAAPLPLDLAACLKQLQEFTQG